MTTSQETYTQHVEPCRNPDGDENHKACTAVVCRRDSDNSVVWVSHMHSDIHAEHRINPEHPAKRKGKGVRHKPADQCPPCNEHDAWRAHHDPQGSSNASVELLAERVAQLEQMVRDLTAPSATDK